jgi:hypothetical protein
VAGYGITEKCVLQLAANANGGTLEELVEGGRRFSSSSIVLRVITPGGEIAVWVDPLDTVNSVKARLEKYVGIPPAQQRLYFGGAPLDGERTLVECNIRERRILILK